MIDMQPQYISPSDFENYWGINLEAKFSKVSSNPSNYSYMFLKRIEDRLMTWIDANTFRDIPWSWYLDDFQCGNEYKQKYIDIQKDYWKKALLEQAMYVIKNSDIGQDSGYDPEKGIVAQQDELQAIEICRPCINFLKSAGLYNHVVRNRVRYTSFN